MMTATMKTVRRHGLTGNYREYREEAVHHPRLRGDDGPRCLMFLIVHASARYLDVETWDKYGTGKMKETSSLALIQVTILALKPKPSLPRSF